MFLVAMNGKKKGETFLEVIENTDEERNLSNAITKIYEKRIVS